MSTTAVRPRPKKSHSKPALTPPAGFEPATADDFTDRFDGWVGPTIVDPEGSPVASATWTPEGDLKRYINSDVYPDSNCREARGVLARLDALIHAAAETCPVSGCVVPVSEHDPSGTHDFESQWLTSDDETVGPLMTVGRTQGPAGEGVHVQIPLELFKDLGAVLDAEGDVLDLRGSIEATSKFAAAIVEAGTKLLGAIAERKQ
ncbi:hypothetical protein [Pseudarthrobacter albicanus]|uniref:hypothetical protein n=1 Tax=Pseudarthrobacter albicanus TaxID=2823873 RepID=UPI001BAE53FF|nr:hypothetical protein [Pseudarthrobacter albicanus]